MVCETLESRDASRYVSRWNSVVICLATQAEAMHISAIAAYKQYRLVGRDAPVDFRREHETNEGV